MQDDLNPDELAQGDLPAPTARTQTSRARAEKVTRRIEALRLRRVGLTYDQIATRMKVSRSTVHHWITDSLKSSLREEAEEVRLLELERLDMVLGPQMRQAMTGDGPAVDRVLKIMERRARYLNLDAATTAGIQEVGNLLDRLVFGPEGNEEGAA